MLLFTSRVMSNHVLHTIDANFNHASGHLCVLEDKAHLSPHNYTSNSKRKTIYHKPIMDIQSPAVELIYSIDSLHDVSATLVNQIGQLIRKIYQDSISFITVTTKKAVQSRIVSNKLSRLPDMNIQIVLLQSE